jgi:hypothetical protein
VDALSNITESINTSTRANDDDVRFELQHHCEPRCCDVELALERRSDNVEVVILFRILGVSETKFSGHVHVVRD